MLKILIDCLIIQFIIVFIIDYANFPATVKSWIAKILTNGKFTKNDYSLKPFDCSLCSTWWVTLIYIICIGEFNLIGVFICVLCAYLTYITKDVLFITNDIWARLMRAIIKKLK